MKYLVSLLAILLSTSLMGQLKTPYTSTNSGSIAQKNIQIDQPVFKSLTSQKPESSVSIQTMTAEALASITVARGSLALSGAYSLKSGQRAEDAAVHLLRSHTETIADRADVDFKLVSSQKDKLGMTHLRYALTHKGIEILNKEVIVHLDKDQYFINGGTVQNLGSVSTTPAISIDGSLKLSKAELGEITPIPQGMHIFEQMQDKSKLVIYTDEKMEAKLAYHHMVFKNLAERWEVIVDATTGEILRKNLAMCRFHNHHGHAHGHHKCSHNHGPTVVEKTEAVLEGPVVSNAKDLFGNTVKLNTYQSSGQYFMIDAARTMYDNANSSMPNSPVGSVWTIDAQNNNPRGSNFKYDHVRSGDINFSGENTAVSAHYNGGLAYEYFKNTHGRESINGSGGNIISFVNVADQNGNSMGNAFWNGVALFYGNGDNAFRPLARGLDVAGHEMAHGVIQSTANLTYYGESGALNESFADIFGVMIDRDDWQVGEDVVRTNAFPSGALRSMSDPHNGASTGQYNKGWQPRVYSERYTGSEDNAGVHINSGIPNYVFYLFATSNGVGKAKAEQVYYRALTKYLTKSSNFADARVAVVKAANDLYGSDVAAKATQAFDKAQIPGGSSGGGTDGGGYQNDVEVNPGSDLILFTTDNGQNLYVATPSGELIFNPLIEGSVKSVPSITDDGTEVVYVNNEKHLMYVKIDWQNKTAEQAALNKTVEWRTAAFSKDGLRIAAVTEALKPEIFVYDFTLQEGKTFTLSNPTYTEGFETGDVQYSDAMQFDFSGEQIMYDALNRIQGNNSTVEYWDIGFIKVFDNNRKKFEADGRISKLFNNLEQGVSIGNPVFSKNSPYIIAFDYIKNSDFKLLGANIETNTVRSIFDSDKEAPSYPSYATKDNTVIFNYNQNNKGIIGGINLSDNKIEGSGNAGIVLSFEQTGVKWGQWFSNGKRDVVSSDNPIADAVRIFPIPVAQTLTVQSTLEGDVSYTLTTMDGKLVHSGDLVYGNNHIDVASYHTGMYILTLKNAETSYSRLVVISK